MPTIKCGPAPDVCQKWSSAAANTLFYCLNKADIMVDCYSIQGTAQEQTINAAASTSTYLDILQFVKLSSSVHSHNNSF